MGPLQEKCAEPCSHVQDTLKGELYRLLCSVQGLYRKNTKVQKSLRTQNFHEHISPFGTKPKYQQLLLH